MKVNIHLFDKMILVIDITKIQSNKNENVVCDEKIFFVILIFVKLLQFLALYLADRMSQF